MRDPDHPPALEPDAQDPARVRLLGQWTLAHANDIGECLRDAPGSLAAVDATAVERLDSAGVLQLQRFARRRGLGIEAFAFREHRARWLYTGLTRAAETITVVM